MDKPEFRVERGPAATDEAFAIGMAKLLEREGRTIAAAELRRLHAENERLAAEVANRNRRALDGDEAVSALANVHAYYEGLEAQRDALLEALRTLLSYAFTLEMRFTDADGEHRAMQQARAAIKSVEGEKNHG